MPTEVRMDLNDNNESRVLLLSYIHTDAAVKTFSIPSQGLFGMSKGISHVSHLDQQVVPLIFELSRVDLTVCHVLTLQ